ncbi:MAG TPA: hypothetical protein VF193_10505 [Steroidobacter sp.]
MLRVSFNLDEEALRHFAEVAQQTSAHARAQSPESVVAAARRVLEKAASAELPGFMKERYSRLETLLEMLADEDWALAPEDRQRVLNALACSTTPPPVASGPELLDQAIMIELVSRDLKHDLEAYQAFKRFRQSRQGRSRGGPEHRGEWLREKRESLQRRMHERRRRDLEAAGSSLRKVLSLFGL